jgi:gliding-associated putative ABC transporter substrate-binding component GldG
MVIMSKTKLTKGNILVNFSGLVAIIVMLNVMAYYFTFRIDLTEDDRYSLSPRTVEMLQDDDRLQERVFFKIYLDGDLPADMKNVRNSVQNLLDEFIAVAGDKIQYEFIDPDGSEDDDYNAQVKQNLFNEGKGILPTYLKKNSSQTSEIQTIWPGAFVEYGGVTADIIQFFDREVIVMDEDVRGLVDKTVNDLEYKFISSIRRVTQVKKKRIGFLQGHGELTKQETWDVRQSLELDYVIGDVEINGKLEAFSDIDALVIAKPQTAFNEKDKFVIDQFVMNGGKVMWFIDPLFVEKDSLAYSGETMALSRNLNIEKDLIYKYGARINADIIIDENSTNELVPPNNLRNPGLTWVFYPLILPEEHPITTNIDPIKLEYSSSVTPVNLSDTNVTKTILLQSSTESKSLMAPVRINYGFAFDQYKPDMTNQEFANNPVAVLLEGRFTSPFENRISDVFVNSAEFKTKFKSGPNKMLVVSDGDMINSSYTYYDKGKKLKAPIPLNVDRFNVLTPNGAPVFNYGNREFFLNAVDYLLGDNSLIGIRSKTITLRMLDQEKIEKDKSFWKFVNIAFPLSFIVFLAIGQTILRKRKYSN